MDDLLSARLKFVYSMMMLLMDLLLRVRLLQLLLEQELLHALLAAVQEQSD